MTPPRKNQQPPEFLEQSQQLTRMFDFFQLNSP